MRSREVRGARVVASLAAIALLAITEARADFSGRVIVVHDGDTLTVLAGEHRERRVRLAGIDAPERGQAYATASRKALAERVQGRTVFVAERGRDGFGRVLGRVYVDGRDVSAEQVRAGYAWVFRRYGEDPLLVAFEAEAKAARRGLWRDPKPAPPWQWRERQPPPARAPMEAPA